MNDNDIYLEYDDILIGKRATFSDRFFGNNPKKNMKNALRIIKYSLTRYLRWPPDALEENLDKELMDKLKLMPLMRFISYPIEYDKEKDYYYLISLLFREKKLDLKEKTIHTYERVLSGELPKYPKDYFTGSDGVVKAGFCLQYMIDNYITFSSMNDLYSMFSTEEGYEKLKEYKLLNACREIFETPVDYLDFILPDDAKDPFLMHYYKFMFLKEMTSDKGRKRKASTDYKLEVPY